MKYPLHSNFYFYSSTSWLWCFSKNIESWITNPLFFDVKKDGFQTITIPVSSVYQIKLIAPGNSWTKDPGVKIVATFNLKQGQKVTVALGQQGSDDYCGSGGSFVVLDGDGGPEPLLVAAGAGYAWIDEEFGRGNFKQTAVGDIRKKSSGIQIILPGDQENVYCAGGGYCEAPEVTNLANGCVPPKTFSEGLTGGKGVDWDGDVTEGGFGGGGGAYARKVNGEEKVYFGAGGGFTGGTTKVHNGKIEDEDGDEIEAVFGGGGGSYSADPNAEFDNQYVEFGYCKIVQQNK